MLKQCFLEAHLDSASGDSFCKSKVGPSIICWFTGSQLGLGLILKCLVVCDRCIYLLDH